MAAGRLCLTADCTLTTGIAMVTSHTAHGTAAIRPGMGTNCAALGTGVPVKAMGTGSRASITLAIGIKQVLTGTLRGAVFQSQGTIGILSQGKRNLDTCRYIQLVRIGNTYIRGNEGNCLGSALEALSHIPLGIVTGLNTDVAFRREGGNQLAVCEFIGTDIGSILVAAIIGTVDEAEQVEISGVIAPGTAAGIPGIFCNGVAVVTIGGDGQIGTLVPLLIPTVGAAVGVHATEDHIGISAGD